MKEILLQEIEALKAQVAFQRARAEHAEWQLNRLFVMHQELLCEVHENARDKIDEVLHELGGWSPST